MGHRCRLSNQVVGNRSIAVTKIVQVKKYGGGGGGRLERGQVLAAGTAQ